MPKLKQTDLFSLSVLQLIRSEPLITRSDIAEKTARSGFLTSRVCDELIEAGFISEVGVGDSTGGRRPALISLKPGLGRLLGIHFGTINLRVAITDFAGNLLEYRQTASEAAQGPEIALQNLVAVIDQMLDQAKISPDQLSGIGIGISAILNAEGTVIHWPRLTSWPGIPIKRILEDRYKVIVMIEDSPRTTALAELQLDPAYQSKILVHVNLGAGTGAAIFVNGSLFRGGNGFAGEIGHLSILELGPVCSCGNRGCLETLISASELIRRAQEGTRRGLSTQLAQLAQEDPDKITVEMLGAACRLGDRFALRLLEDASRQLGRALVSVVNLINPDYIVIGGGIAAAAGEFVISRVASIVSSTAMVPSARHVVLRLSRLDETGPAIGATLLVAEAALTKLFLQRGKFSKGRSERVAAAR